MICPSPARPSPVPVWRMTFRMGGAPPGAMLSAFAQMGAVAVVGIVLAFPLIILPAVLGPGPLVRVASLGATLLTAAALWALWWAALGRAAAALDRRREQIVDRLARPTEAG